MLEEAGAGQARERVEMNNMNQHFWHVAVAAMMVLPSASALADDGMAGLKGWYGGASYGWSKAKDSCDDSMFGELPDNVTYSQSCDDTDHGHKFFVGYQVTPILGVEAAYVDLGKFRQDGSLTQDWGEGYASTSRANGAGSVDGFSLALVGTAPITDNFAVFGKVGAYAWDLDVNGDYRSQTTYLGEPLDEYSVLIYSNEDGTSLLLGLGAKYNFTPNLGIRAEWERYKGIGEHYTTGKSDVDLISLGLFANF